MYKGNAAYKNTASGYLYLARVVTVARTFDSFTILQVRFLLFEKIFEKHLYFLWLTNA